MRTIIDTRALARRGRVALAGLAALGTAGCELGVADPGIVRPDQLTTEQSLPTLRAGAIGDFAVAYAGNPENDTEGIILVGGLRADEWQNRDTFGTRREVDLGTIQIDNASNQGAFRLLQRARASAEFAASRYEELGPGEPGGAEVLVLAGFSTVLLGEHYCSGIPFSTLNQSGEFEFGQPLSTQQVFERAVERFEAALAAARAAEDEELEHAAQVGLGRALVNLGRYAEAAQAVAGVPDDFSYDIEYSANTDRQNNAVFTYNNINRRWGVADAEGGNGLAFVSAADPRVPTTLSTRNGLDNLGGLYFQQKYPDRETNIPLATGVEARLIEAEAALNGGPGNALAILNGLRATVPDLAPLAAANADVLFEERGFWLFATGHRLGDMRRLLTQYGRTYEDVFPTGSYFKGGLQYGTQANLPIPVDERNNPNFVACADPTV